MALVIDKAIMCNKESQDECVNTLDLKTKLGYGAGGVLNVMSVTMINSYLLMFYHGVIHLSNRNAGIIMLVGKISGGISNILIGFISDITIENCWLYNRFGKRKVCIYLDLTEWMYF